MESSYFYKPIGIIRSPFKERKGMPIQSVQAQGMKGKIILNEVFVPGLKDLDGYSHIILIYHFHKSKGYELQIKPFLDETKRGVFSTRAPKRPNQIGISVVKLLNIEDNILYIENVDMIDETPLLDLKPYIEEFDVFSTEKKGWFEMTGSKPNNMRSDDRFR